MHRKLMLDKEILFWALLMLGLGGIVAHGQTLPVAQVPPLGSTFLVENYAGSDFVAKIAACGSAALAAHGTCDARSLGGPQASTNELDVNFPLIVPASAVWTFSPGFAYGCGMKVETGGYVRGDVLGGAPSFFLNTGSNANNMEALLCVDGNSGTGTPGYAHVDGVGVRNDAGTYFVSGAAHVHNLDDQSDLRRVYVWNNSGDAWHMEGICCGAVFDQIQGYASNGFPTNVGAGTYSGSYAQGGMALVVDGTTSPIQALTISNSTFNAPKTSSYNIKILGVSALTFNNVYAEGNGATDTTTPMVYVDATSKGVTFLGGSFSNFCPNTGCTSKYAIENHSVNALAVMGLYGYAGGWIKDVANGQTIPALATGIVNSPYIAAAGTYIPPSLAIKPGSNSDVYSLVAGQNPNDVVALQDTTTGQGYFYARPSTGLQTTGPCLMPGYQGDLWMCRSASGVVQVGTTQGSSDGTVNLKAVIPSGSASANTNGTASAPWGQNWSVLYGETLTTPASSSATCTAGQFTDDASYHYVCTATNTWKRVALNAF